MLCQASGDRPEAAKHPSRWLKLSSDEFAGSARAMGAKSSKPPPRRIEPEVTAVEVFQDTTPQAPREPSSNHKRQKGVAPAQGGTAHVVRSILQEPPPQTTTASETPSKPPDTQTGSDDSHNAKDGKLKKKRRRSKKEKNKLPPPKLVRAQTQLNELKNVKPLLQQSPKPGSNTSSRLKMRTRWTRRRRKRHHRILALDFSTLKAGGRRRKHPQERVTCRHRNHHLPHLYAPR